MAFHGAEQVGTRGSAQHRTDTSCLRNETDILPRPVKRLGDTDAGRGGKLMRSKRFAGQIRVISQYKPVSPMGGIVPCLRGSQYMSYMGQNNPIKKRSTQSGT